MSHLALLLHKEIVMKIKEDAPSGTTTASIPVKVVVTPETEILYKRKNQRTNTPLTESFLEFLERFYG